jgi:hypothetical protein
MLINASQLELAVCVGGTDPLLPSALQGNADLPVHYGIVPVLIPIDPDPIAFYPDPYEFVFVPVTQTTIIGTKPPKPPVTSDIEIFNPLYSSFLQ